MSQMPFGQRLRTAMDQYGPLCVGIDPHPGLLAKWGLPDDADGVRKFSLTVLDASAGRAAAVKPQSALFERHGAAGVAVLAEVVAKAKELGVLCIVDAKRSDIGSTMNGYADAYLDDGSDLAGDAVTLSPYLGFGSLEPAITKAQQTGRGVFILCLTSNPEGVGVQHAVNPATGQSVAKEVAQAAAATNTAQRLRSETAEQSGQPWLPSAPAKPLGDVGLVVGATVGSAVSDLGIDLAAVNGPLLAPGIGAQGATATELKQVFGPARPDVLASSSREILGAGPKPADLNRAILATAEAVSAALHD